MLARLAILPTIFPTNGLLPLPPLSEKATIRRRRLPSDMVLWLVVGMAFFRNEPISEVARRLNICAEGWPMMPCSRTVPCLRPVSDSANSRSSGCSNSAPMWGRERYPEDHWHGLQVFAIDGALFRTQDMPELRAHFGSVTPQPTGRHPTRCCGWSRS